MVDDDGRRRSPPLLAPGDIIIDGGNSYYRDDIRPRDELLKTPASTTSTSGTSGGVWGLERGYCLMIGGEDDVVARLDPIFATLAPGVDARRAHRRAQRRRRAAPSTATCTAARTAPGTS